MPVIWIPDGEPFEVEWYTSSEGKATGVERMSTGFVAHEVDRDREIGFAPPPDRIIDRGLPRARRLP